MELREFISTTIQEIVDGVEEAEKAISEKGAHINPKVKIYEKDGSGISEEYGVHRTVLFDIVLTETNGKEGRAGIGVSFVELSGGKDSQSSSSTSVHFSIPLGLPLTANKGRR